MWSEIKKQKKVGDHDSVAFEFFFEERIWHMVSMIDQFDLRTISDGVIKSLQSKEEEGEV